MILLGVYLPSIDILKHVVHGSGVQIINIQYSCSLLSHFVLHHSLEHQGPSGQDGFVAGEHLLLANDAEVRVVHPSS